MYFLVISSLLCRRSNSIIFKEILLISEKFQLIWVNYTLTRIHFETTWFCGFRTDIARLGSPQLLLGTTSSFIWGRTSSLLLIISSLFVIDIWDFMKEFILFLFFISMRLMRINTWVRGELVILMSQTLATPRS